MDFFHLGCFLRYPKAKSHIIIDARWVITWTMIDGNFGVKCRLAVRHLKDAFQDFDTYAGTTNHSGPKFVNTIAVGNDEFILTIFDVSQAFAKGLSFEELSKVADATCRVVQVDVPKLDLDYFQQVKGVENFTPPK